MDHDKIKTAIMVVIVVAATLAALIVAFRVGEFVGYGKAQFSSRWGEHYERNFTGPGRSPIPGLPLDMPSFLNAHGVVGRVVSVDETTLVVQGQDAEKTVLVSPSTSIVKMRDAARITDIAIGDDVSVIGKPDDQGRIEAGIIRIFPKR